MEKKYSINFCMGQLVTWKIYSNKDKAVICKHLKEYDIYELCKNTALYTVLTLPALFMGPFAFIINVIPISLMRIQLYHYRKQKNLLMIKYHSRLKNYVLTLFFGSIGYIIPTLYHLSKHRKARKFTEYYIKININKNLKRDNDIKRKALAAKLDKNNRIDWLLDKISLYKKKR